MFKREDIREGQRGYYKKCLIRYMVCNNSDYPGYRCTRETGHAKPHAAHTVMGIPGTTEEIKDENGMVIDVRVIPGMKNTEDVQIATW